MTSPDLESAVRSNNAPPNEKAEISNDIDMLEDPKEEVAARGPLDFTAEELAMEKRYSIYPTLILFRHPPSRLYL